MELETRNSKPETWSETDQRMMARALELAERGVGQVSPSPLVGCVIASAAGKILGEGFYLYEQIEHAESIALKQAGGRARGEIAYVSLEPHSHYGRTPPCTESLINAGIRRVVAPIEDPNPLVCGKGFAALRAAGLEVRTGLFELEARRLNEGYIHSMRHGRPFIHLKLASSLDGRIATRTGNSRWITGEESRARVQELRHMYDAILVGAGTASADDPILTDRTGRARRLPLVRVLLDKELRLSPDSQMAKTAREYPTIVFASDRVDGAAVSSLRAQGVEILTDATGGYDLKSVLRELGRRGIQSVLVEGGANIAGRLFDAHLVDKVSFFVAPIVIGGRDAPSAIAGMGVGTIAEAAVLRDVEVVGRGRDVEITGYPKYDNEMKAEA